MYCRQVRAKRSHRQQQTNTAEYLNAVYEEAESPPYQSWGTGPTAMHSQGAESNTSTCTGSDRKLPKHHDEPQSSTVLTSKEPPSYYSLIGVQPPPTQPPPYRDGRGFRPMAVAQ